ncbi:DNA polymerase III subunit epsilon [Sphingomonas sp. R1]|uniref:DNA polymerase III subunit epsilon n=1 Tax=Sphingomonas sp. R1 TaxID=399176 RepID=UPI0022251532|nr:DNA polymerase III subunit epsilon [Sphingomonas sp. R1]UYY76853.1 DNA polymerase III subunit epsilon [Sphingomonas sp. R1]
MAAKPAIALKVTTSGSEDAGDLSVSVVVRLFLYDADGVVSYLGKPQLWRNRAPSVCSGFTEASGSPEAGQFVDDVIGEQAFLDMLRTSSIIVSHGAAFARPWIESQLPQACDLPWACSMTQIDWRSHGLQGRSLGYLLCQIGWFIDPEDEASEVDGLIQLLRHRFENARSALSQLVEQASHQSWILRAYGASFHVKDELRDRGYRWDADLRVWWKEVSDAEKLPEELWLAINVYRTGRGARGMGPECEELTAKTRFR